MPTRASVNAMSAKLWHTSAVRTILSALASDEYLARIDLATSASSAKGRRVLVGLMQ